MPALSALAIRLALLHLAAGLTAGSLLLAHKGIVIFPWAWRLLPVHAELMLIGWTVQLALAVAHWIIPRFRGGEFGRLALAQVSLVLLNAGVLLVVTTSLAGLPSTLILLGRLLEIVALLAFVIYIWPRIRPLGQ